MLTTYQFRLRDIQKVKAIVKTSTGEDGDDDYGDGETQYHYTLHRYAELQPLFTSPKCRGEIERFTPLPEETKTCEFPELKKDFEQDSPRTSVVIRLWRTSSRTEEDRLVSCYGIHFSGLYPYSRRLRPHLKANSIVLVTRCGHSFVPPSCIDWSSCSSTAIPETLASDATPQPNQKFTSIAADPSKIHACCTLEQLLKLQQSQLRLKYKRELLRSLVMEIQSKSAICMDEAALQSAAPSQHYYAARHNHQSHHHNNHAVGSMGKTLTRLLNMDPEPVDPKTQRQAFKLRKQIEAVRVRCRMLAVERDRARQQVKNLERQRAENCDRNVETDSLIMANYHGMSKEKEQYLHLKLTLTKNLETLLAMRAEWRARQQQLLTEMCEEVYEVRDHAGGQYTINGISLPDAEAYDQTHVPALSISVALGYVAHMVIVTASVLGVPLRNPVLFKGSQSMIMSQLLILNNNL